MELCPFEQVENLIIEIKKVQSDIENTDNELFEEKDLDTLAKEAKKLAEICERTSKQIKEELEED